MFEKLKIFLSCIQELNAFTLHINKCIQRGLIACLLTLCISLYKCGIYFIIFFLFLRGGYIVNMPEV